MMSVKNLVSILISQHRVLQEELSKLLKISNNKKNKVEIFKILNKFKQDLQEHLELENNTFYVELLKKMQKKELETQNTQEFINEIKKIEKIVYKFLNKYSSEEKISKNIDKFYNELIEISKILTLRIESEEAGVYSYWFLF